MHRVCIAALSVSSPRLKLSSQPELSVRILAQTTVEYLVPNALVVRHVIDLSEMQMPGRISLELDLGPEDDQQVGFLHDALSELHVEKSLFDVGGRDLMLLGHLRQRLRKIDHGVTAIFGAYQSHGEVTGCSPKVRGLWAGWRLYRLGMGCANCQ